jgi:hypothetical protein
MRQPFIKIFKRLHAVMRQPFIKIFKRLHACSSQSDKRKLKKVLDWNSCLGFSFSGKIVNIFGL